MSNPSYAPNPKKQPVYNNLQNKTLASVEAADIQKLTDPTFIQSSNQDASLRQPAPLRHNLRTRGDAFRNS